ncbi:MAG: glycosyltransferase family 39 protein [Acetobacter sp.]|nr:glycosyltransferase family 39 protein [Acetobacter sp.]
MRCRAHLFGVNKYLSRWFSKWLSQYARNWPRHPSHWLSRYFLWLGILVAVTGLRWVLAAYVPLSPDEAYYRLWALAPAAGYLDHPPMVALCMRLGMLIGGDTAFGLRFMAPVLMALSSLCLVAAVSVWLGREEGRAAGVGSAILFNATLAIGIGAMIMTPDTPLIFFVSVILWLLSCLCARGSMRESGWLWLGIAFVAGLALDSKYSAALPIIGVGIWICLSSESRRCLRTIWLWLAIALGGGVISPVLWWNATHHWASFLKQGGRVGNWHPAQALKFMGELLGGQVGLMTPLIFVLFIGGCVCLWQKRDRFSVLLLCTILFPLCVFIQHAMGARVQANWPLVIYPALALAGACWYPRWWFYAPVLGILLTSVVIGQALWAPLPLSPHRDVMARQVGGWRNFAKTVDVVVPLGLPIMADDYGLASELAFYMPQQGPKKRVVVAVGARWRLFTLPHPACGMQGYLVRSHRRTDQPSKAWFDVSKKLFVSLERRQKGVILDRYALYRVKLHCEGKKVSVLEAARLPSPLMGVL